MASQLIKNYMSPDNAVRTAAENELTQALATNFQAGYELLLSAIQLEEFEV